MDQTNTIVMKKEPKKVVKKAAAKRVVVRKAATPVKVTAKPLKKAEVKPFDNNDKMVVKLTDNQKFQLAQKVMGTGCCALHHLRFYESMTENNVNDAIRYSIKCGARAAFVITTALEPKLAILLEKLEFKMVFEFNRRKEYNDPSLLKMWVKKLN